MELIVKHFDELSTNELLKATDLHLTSSGSLKRKSKKIRRIQEFCCRMSEDPTFICIWHTIGISVENVNEDVRSRTRWLRGLKQYIRVEP
ncbi:hypothetical protein SAMN04487928_14721 [Butyrivibrio proteoclasticus]|uniref:Uncharacterized protein n=1 Tax=Butyrivibrio proteoclasticus TaxID=43305 RepID=A0A1I5YIM3_9FIRM|nr:hypothetical protein [Butyrivibrio proteoclasticus]SFQ44059.1 hypothetical protein SAMN04487928_14721 [Butyrivibrio proteoclasticus]